MKNNLIFILFVIGVILFFSPMLYTSAGFVPATIITISMVGGLAVWIKFPLLYPTEPKKIIPIYALMVTSLWFHILEEYEFDFGPRLGEAIHSGWTGKEFLFSFGYFLPILWILGLIGLAYRHPLGYYMASFVAFGMFLGEPTHLLVFPILEGGRYHYFPGMWTALIPMIFGIWTLQVMIGDARREKKNV
jgi:hypothetical protein